MARMRNFPAEAGSLLLLIALSAVAVAVPLYGQPLLDGDLTWTRLYVFRGEVLSSAPALEPRLWMNTHTPVGRLSIGMWTLIEPYAARDHHFSLRGETGGPFSEVDAWAQSSWEFLGSDFTVGLSANRFVNHSALSLEKASRVEAFISAERALGLPITEAAWYRLNYTRGFGESGGSYAEFSLGNQWLLLALRDISLTLTGTAGFNLAEPRQSSLPGGRFSRRGVTHYELAAVLASVPHCAKPHRRITLRNIIGWLTPNQIGGRIQLGRDSVTRYPRPDTERSSFGWIDVTWSPTHCAHFR